MTQGYVFLLVLNNPWIHQYIPVALGIGSRVKFQNFLLEDWRDSPPLLSLTWPLLKPVPAVQACYPPQGRSSQASHLQPEANAALVRV